MKKGIVHCGVFPFSFTTTETATPGEKSDPFGCCSQIGDPLSIVVKYTDMAKLRFEEE